MLLPPGLMTTCAAVEAGSLVLLLDAQCNSRLDEYAPADVAAYRGNDGLNGGARGYQQTRGIDRLATAFIARGVIALIFGVNQSVSPAKLAPAVPLGLSALARGKPVGLG